MNILYIIYSIGFFLWITKTVLFWTYLWQLKEYRLDRLLVHLKGTIQGKSILLSPFLLINFLFIIGFTFVILNEEAILGWYNILGGLFFIVEGLYFISQIIKNSFRRPTFTPKALIISLGSIFILSIIYSLPLTTPIAWLLLVQLLSPLIVAIFVFTFSFPTELHKDYLIEKAKEKMRNQKNLLVIAVSGSYGKSSTKEYMAHVLSEKFSVVKTHFSNNTPIAVAKTILSELKNNTDILIVEIGSYKKGEVKELADIISPKISVTTGISDQHLALYGSMKNILETEMELLESLNKNGLALLNGNSLFIMPLFDKSKKKTQFYVSGETSVKVLKKDIGIFANNIKSSKNGVQFDAYVKQKKISFETDLIGTHVVENILPGIYVGSLLGMTQKEIQNAVSTLQPLQKTMKKIVLQQGIVVIDDTFNASPESVLSAALYASFYTKKKIFVLTPLIELGNKSREYHYKTGKALAHFDYLFLTNKNYKKEIELGIRDSKGKCSVIVDSSSRIAAEIEKIAQKGDIIICEGKEAGNVLNQLI